VAEGLSASEVGKEIGEHARHVEHEAARSLHRHARALSVAEAVLLSVVALTAAWSGYAAAKWSTEASLKLAKASATRAKANRAYQGALTFRSQDAADFNAWFTAYLLGDRRGQQIAERRFRPQYDVAFRAWLKTKPFTNPDAPKGPQYMPQYHPTGAAAANVLDGRADVYYAQGQHAGRTGDKYIRVTVILASVLFLVGISSHFPLVGIRVGLVCIGAVLLLFAAVEILQLPRLPA
jgi:uncharacterized membrane-anchored protein